MPLFNLKDLIWQLWAGSSSDLLTLTKRENTTPCDVCSKNLTSPVRVSNQPVPGVTHKNQQLTPNHFELGLCSYSTPQNFLLQPPDSGWSLRFFCWFDTWEWKDPQVGSSQIPEEQQWFQIPVGEIGPALNQDSAPSDFQTTGASWQQMLVCHESGRLRRQLKLKFAK